MKSFKSVNEIFSRAQMKKAIGIARKSKGQYTKAYNKIEKIKKGLGDEHIIAAALKRANEDTELDEAKVNLKKLQKQFDRNEDQNRHSENYLLLAKTFGTPQEIKQTQKIIKLIDKQGYLKPEQNRWMYDNLSKYFRKVYPSGRRESVQEDKETETLFYKLFGMTKREWDANVKRVSDQAKKTKKPKKEDLDLEETTYSKIVLRGKNTKDEKKIKGLAKKAKVEVVNVKKGDDGLHMVFTHKSNKTLEGFTSQLKDFGSVHFGGPEKTYKPYMEAKKLDPKQKAVFIKDLERDKAKLFVKAMKMVANSPKQMKVRKELDKVWDKIMDLQTEALEEIFEGTGPFDDKQIERLRKSYGKLKTLDVDSSKYHAFRKMITTMPKDQLIQLRDAGIKFVSVLAANTLWLKHNIKDSYELVCDTPNEIVEAVAVDCRRMGFKASMRRKEGQKQSGRVIVDRRTKGAKAAELRAEKNRLKREKAKGKADLDEVISKASASLQGQSEDMSYSGQTATGPVDMTPHAKKGLDGKSPVDKKKEKDKMIFKNFVAGRSIGNMVP